MTITATRTPRRRWLPDPPVSAPAPSRPGTRPWRGCGACITPGINLIHRSNNKIASFAWGSISSLRNVNWMYGNGFCGSCSPRGRRDRPAPGVLPSLFPSKYEVTWEGSHALCPPNAVYRYQMDGGGSGPPLCRSALERYAFHSFETADGSADAAQSENRFKSTGPDCPCIFMSGRD